VPKLPPIVPLRASSKLAGLTSMMWDAITPTGRDRFLKSDLDAWQAENVRLAHCVRDADDDESLIKLVRRDPRYLGTDLRRHEGAAVEVANRARDGSRTTRSYAGPEDG
jgi:hypothetical protein